MKIIVFSTIFLLLIGYFFGFVMDIGINSSYFIGKNFTKAFEYRMSGDCVAFSNYFNIEADRWKHKCESDKKGEEVVTSFKIKNISNELGSDRAFLQIELSRFEKNSNKEVYFSNNYEMKKVNQKWLIDSKCYESNCIVPLPYIALPPEYWENQEVRVINGEMQTIYKK